MASSHIYHSQHKVGIHHYADHFVRDGWRTCFLASQLSPLHLLRQKERIFSLEKFNLWRTGGQASDSFFSYSFLSLLPVLPFWTNGFILDRHFKWTVPPLGSVLRKRGFDEVDILWISNPQAAGLRGFLKHRLLVHRVTDAWNEFDGIPARVKKTYSKAHEQCDLIIVTAGDLFNNLESKYGSEKVLYIPNGCDFNHFRKRAIPTPAAYESIPSPRALFMGIIGPWFDQDLLISCASRLKEISFIVIGPAVVDISRLYGEKNIHVLGPRRYSDLPPYVINADVGMIPFKRNRFVQSIHPLKLYEYMASGLPVVSSDWEELRKIASPAFLADSGDGFCDALKACLSWNNRDVLVNFASKNDWSDRYGRIKAEIDRRLGL